LSVITPGQEELVWKALQMEVLFDICELVKNKNLDSLKLAVLKEIGNQLHLTKSGPLSRKKTFFEAIEKFSESCPCFQK